MKIFFIVILTAIFANAQNTAGYGGATAPATTHTVPADTNNTSGAISNNTLLGGDAEIAQVLVTINEGEIDAGLLAAKRATSTEVKDFAKSMVSDHKDNIKKTKSVQKKLSSSTTSRLLKDEAKMMNGHLKSNSKTDFDRAYVASQVEMHGKALSMLNNTLIPAAGSEALKTHLQATRDAVTEHLNHARMLQSTVK